MENSLLELFFPRFCIGCGYIGVYVCERCAGKLITVNKTTCFYCKEPSLLGFTHPKCRKNDGVDGFLTSYLYSGLFKKILHESKYNGAFAVLKSLLSFVRDDIYQNLGAWKRLFNPFISYVPLHQNRAKQRGFNQSEIIAEQYSYITKIPSINCLSRTKDTSHLASMKDKNERKKQIKNAFIYTGQTLPQSVILVDDVITTGATVLECAKVLKRNGVRTVLTISLANG